MCSISDPILPNKFDGKNFCIWEKETELYLTYLKLDKYLTDDKPTNPIANTDVFNLVSEEVWIHGDYMCKRVILGQLIDLFIHCILRKKMSKTLWLSLEKNHKADVMR